MKNVNKTLLLGVILAMAALPTASALSVAPLSLNHLVVTLDDTVSGTVHGVLAPIEKATAPDPAPDPAAAPAPAPAPRPAAPPATPSPPAPLQQTSQPPASTATAPKASGFTVTQLAWLIAGGAALVGLGVAAMGGPMSRARAGTGRAFARAIVILALIAAAVALGYVSWITGLADTPAVWPWIAVVAIAWCAIVLGAAAMGRPAREERGSGAPVAAIAQVSMARRKPVGDDVASVA